MATANELFKIVREVDSATKNQVAWFCWNAAKAIFQEAGSVQDHATRIVWAKKLLADDGTGATMKQITRMVLIVLATAGPYTDVEIETVVGQIIDKIAVVGV